MKIFVPLICYNHTCNTEFMMSMMKFMLFCKTNNIDIVIYPITFESLVNRARNAAVALFMSENDATHILFIDSDIQFEPEDVVKLISADQDVVGGAYPQKWLDMSKYNGNKLSPLELCTKMSVHIIPDSPQQIMKARYVTTGFLLIKREVFTKMMASYPERQYVNNIDGYSGCNPVYFYDFFTVAVNPDTKELESEDYGFSRLWRNIGGDIHVATNITLRHFGWYGYTGNLFRQLTEI